MSNISNNSLLTLFSEFQGVFGQYTSAAGGSSSTSFCNSVFEGVQAYNDVKSKDSKTQDRGIFTIIKLLVKLVKKIASLVVGNETANATSEVTKNNSDIVKTQTDLNTNQQNISTATKEFDSLQTQTIGNLKDAGEDLKASQEKLEEEQKKINDILKQIQQKQTELSNSEDPTSVLNSIKELSAQLITSTGIIQSLKTDIEKLSEVATQAAEKMDKAVDVYNEKISEQTNNIQNNQVALANGSTTAVGTQVEGDLNAVTSTTSTGIGTAAASTVFTMPASTPALKIGVDQGVASGVRISGAVAALTQISNGIGTLMGNETLLGTFANAIGLASNEFSGLLGGIQTDIKGSITAIGSIIDTGNIVGLKKELDTAVETDLESLNDNDNTKQYYNQNDNNNDDCDVNFNYDAKRNGIDPELLEKFETPKVKVTLLS